MTQSAVVAHYAQMEVNVLKFNGGCLRWVFINKALLYVDNDTSLLCYIIVFKTQNISATT